MSRLDELGLWELGTFSDSVCIHQCSCSLAHPHQANWSGQQSRMEGNRCRYQNLVLPQAQQPLEHPHPEEGAKELVRAEAPGRQHLFNKYSWRRANPPHLNGYISQTICSDLEATMIVDGLS